MQAYQEPDRQLTVVAAPHPFRMERRIIHLRAGQDLEELLAEIQPDPRLRGRALVQVDGRPARPGQWAGWIPAPGSLVTIRVVPQGRGIAMIFLAIASIIAVALTYGALAPLIGATWAGLASGLAGLTVGVVGSLMVNALIPPPSHRAGQESTEKSTYFVSGARNQLIRYGNIPWLAGRTRLVPVKIALDYTEVLGNEQYVRCLFGQHGAVSLSDLRVGETNISEFEGVDLEIRQGFEGDEPITLYTTDVYEEGLYVELEYNNPAVRTSQLGPRELSVDVTCPQGLYQFDDEGGRNSRSITIRIEYREEGISAWTYVTNLVLNGNTTQPVRKGYKWPVNPEGEADIRYEVGLTRMTGNDGSRQVSVSYWTALRSIKPTTPINYPLPLAEVAVRIKASEQLSGTLDEFNCLGESILADWDTATETWITRETRNPAAIFRAILQGQGNPRPFADGRLDLEKLAYWHEFCETNGFTYGRNIDTGSPLYDLLREVAAIGRATVAEVDGKWSVVVDEPQASHVQIFSSRNILKESLEVELLYPDLPHAFRVTFNNENVDYQTDERIVLADGYQIDGLDAWGEEAPELPPATKFEQLDLPGVTGPEHAFKLARYHLAVAQLRPRRIQFKTDWESLVVTRGDRIKFNHDVMLVGLGTGRITEIILEEPSGYLAGVKIDELVAMVEAVDYCLRIRSVGEEIFETVVTEAGETDTLMLETPFMPTEFPAVGDLVIFGEADLESIDLLVVNIEREAELKATLSCVDYSPAVYEADQGTIPEFVSGISIPTEWYTPEIDSMRSGGEVLLRDEDGSWISRILVSFTPVLGLDRKFSHIQAQWKYADDEDGEPVSLLTPLEDWAVSLAPVEDGINYQLRFRYMKGSLVGPWTSWVEHEVEGKTAPPADVAAMTIYQRGDMLDISWPPVADLDRAGYEVRYGAKDCTWEEAATAHGDYRGTAFVTTLIPPGEWDILIKAFDTAGNFSENPARKTFNVIQFYEVLYDEAMAPGWAGTLTNLVRNPLTGHLNVEDQDPASGDNFNVFDNYAVNPPGATSYETPEIDLGENKVVRAWARIYDALGAGEAGSKAPTMYVDYREDGGSYDGWEEWTINYIDGRYVKFKLAYDYATGPLKVLEDFQPVLDVSNW